MDQTQVINLPDLLLYSNVSLVTIRNAFVPGTWSNLTCCCLG